MACSDKTPRCLAIGGLDPSAFAGCSADARNFEALGVMGFATATCVTAQTPTRFVSSSPVDPATVGLQIQLILHEFGPMPIKIGLVPDLSIAQAIHDQLQSFPGCPVVLDPVLAPSATTDIPFIDAGELAQSLFRQTLLLTPNIPEAQHLLGCSIQSLPDMDQACRDLHAQFGCQVLLKGGHLNSVSDSPDIFYDGYTALHLPAARAQIRSVHGSGCFLSATITAYLALDFALKYAIKAAKHHISTAFAQPSFVSGEPRLDILTNL